MPLYTFRNTENEEIWEQMMTIEEKEQYLREQPHLEQLITKVSITDPIRSGITKRHPALTEKFNSIKRYYRGSTVNV
jgi:hypothetical protein